MKKLPFLKILKWALLGLETSVRHLFMFCVCIFLIFSEGLIIYMFIKRISPTISIFEGFSVIWVWICMKCAKLSENSIYICTGRLCVCITVPEIAHTDQLCQSEFGACLKKQTQFRRSFGTFIPLYFPSKITRERAFYN